MSEEGITRSTGNVFADLERPDAAEALVKADLAREIVRHIQRRDWTQARAAKALGIDQPKVSALMRGRLRDFSIDRLMRFLTDLGQEVEIAVRPKANATQHAEVRVSVEDDPGEQTAPVHAASFATSIAGTAMNALSDHIRATNEATLRAFGPPIHKTLQRAFMPSTFNDAAQGLFARPQIGGEVWSLLTRPLIDPQVLDAIARPLIDPGILDEITRPIASELARSLQAFTGALAFGDVLLSFHAAGETIAALVVAGQAKMTIGEDESVLEFPATDEVVDGLVAEGVLAPPALTEERPRLLQLRVRGREHHLNYAPFDEYLATGD